MRTLALDVGLRRVGVAISDPTGTLARTLAVVRRDSHIWNRIGDWVRDEVVGEVVVGLPLLLDGTRGAQAQEVEEFARQLEQHVRVSVRLWDERLSTVEAQRLMIDAGRSQRDRRDRIDAVAAAVILQDFLDAQHAEG